MRLRRPDGSLVAPASVLPTAEKSGLIQMIDQRVLELALKKLAEHPEMRIAVNISGQTLHEPDFFSRLRVLLDARSGTRPPPDHRTHRNLRHRRRRGDHQGGIGPQAVRGQGRHGRLRRRPHLVQEPAAFRFRYGEDRRRFRAEHGAVGGRPVFRAHLDRPRAPCRHSGGGGMGRGQGHRRHAARLGRRLSPGRLFRRGHRADRPLSLRPTTEFQPRRRASTARATKARASAVEGKLDSSTPLAS